MRLGLYGPAYSERRGVSSFKALSPLVPRARTGVSPALPWNALGCVGAEAAATVAALATNPLRLAPSDQLRTGTDQGNPTV